MYIGPWQEFKLARIIQLKDRVDQEQEEENRIDNIRHQQNPHKAYSVGNKLNASHPFAAA
jgi:hypothetical protein